MFGDFMGLAMDSLVNQSAKYWYLSHEQRSVPLVVRSAVGGGGRFGAIDSQTHATWFQGIPGLKIAFPSSPTEAKGLLKGAIRDDNPVIFLEHKRLYSVKEPGPADGEVLPLGSGLLGRVAEHGLHDLDDAWLLATDELPIPYSPTLEDAFIPGAAAIAATVRGRAGIAVGR